VNSSFKSPKLRLAAAALLALLLHVTLEAVDVKTQYDKAFDFKTVRTWGWNPEFRGDVKMARTPDDDPEVMKQKAEPWIVDAVAKEMERRKLTHADANPDVTVTYYLLLSTGASAQIMGQFLPATTQWGVPPFAPATQSLEIMNQGSLVLDVTRNKTVIWRGVAQAKISLDSTDQKREQKVREGVRDLLKKFPPKS
jgi:hypothetical protein